MKQTILIPPRRQPGAVPAVVAGWRRLGLTDADVARVLEVSPQAVDTWISGKKPFPAVRHCALIHMVALLAYQGLLNGQAREIQWFRREKLACEDALRAVELAFVELAEGLGGEVSEHVIVVGGFFGRVMAKAVDLDVRSEMLDREIAECERLITALTAKLKRHD
jgi:hypothetical protein